MYLDHRWVITPVGGLDKISSFAALFGANKLHVAVLSDFHSGVKKKVRDLKESDLLRKGHVFSAEMYVDQPEADVEDLLGRSLYIALVNACYSLSPEYRLPEAKLPEASIRVLKEVEDHFKTLPPEIQEFNHYKPASYLIEHFAKLQKKLPAIGDTLDRFEKLFKDLNKLLPT